MTYDPAVNYGAKLKEVLGDDLTIHPAEGFTLGRRTTTTNETEDEVTKLVIPANRLAPGDIVGTDKHIIGVVVDEQTDQVWVYFRDPYTPPDASKSMILTTDRVLDVERPILPDMRDDEARRNEADDNIRAHRAQALAAAELLNAGAAVVTQAINQLTSMGFEIADVMGSKIINDLSTFTSEMDLD